MKQEKTKTFCFGEKSTFRTGDIILRASNQAQCLHALICCDDKTCQNTKLVNFEVGLNSISPLPLKVSPSSSWKIRQCQKIQCDEPTRCPQSSQSPGWRDLCSRDVITRPLLEYTNINRLSLITRHKALNLGTALHCILPCAEYLDLFSFLKLHIYENLSDKLSGVFKVAACRCKFGD